jgi:PII-like signaling protein
MEQKRNIILRGTESFSRGELDNLALSDGTLVLDEAAGQHVLYGCYTGPELAMPPFCSLSVSWNAETPHGTVVEAQCRVLTGNNWSGWKSFGKWSPEYPRRSLRSAGDAEGFVFVTGDLLTVGVPGGATGVQLRMYLYTEDARATPGVRLLAAAVRPLQWEKLPGAPVNRSLFLPEYDISSHDTRFGASMDLPLTLAALVNRHGADVLPEELAYAMSDAATGDCRNAAYAAAAAGACGYECYQAWMDLREVRAEVRAGCALAVELEKAGGARSGGTVWMGLRGFGHDDAVLADYVQLNDPAAPRGAVARTMALRDFERYFTGHALVVHLRPGGGWGVLPRRMGCMLKASAPGEYQFEYRGAPLPLAENFGGWLACAPRGGDAFATTAQRTFYRLEKTPAGGIRLPDELRRPGARYTVFAVDEAGAMRVAELQLPGEVRRLEPEAAQAAPDWMKGENE